MARRSSPGALALVFLCVSAGLCGAPPSFLDRYDYAGFGAAAVADVNNDGNDDMVTGNPNEIAVLLGNGNGTFRSGPVSNISFQPGEIIAADVNVNNSFLCHYSYCNGYRKSARTGNTPDSASGNMGFRVARDTV